MTEPRAHLVATTTHGRYLVDAPAGAGPFPVLYGFHGYGESAAAQLPHLARLDPAHAWLRVSVQGLHRFYTRANQVVASWMTREDRLEAIADNAAYAAAVQQAVARDYPVGPDHVVVGFSQGAAQAYRAAARSAGACRGVIALAATCRPTSSTGSRAAAAGADRPRPIRRVVHGGQAAGRSRGVARRRRRGDGVEFDGGHEWADAFIVAASAWLAQRLAEPS